MLNKRHRVLSEREQRRRYERELKKKGATSISSRREGSGISYTVSLSRGAFLDVSSGVTASIFGISQESVNGLDSKVNRSNALFTAFPRTVESLFHFPSDAGYFSLVSSAVKAAEDLRQAQQDYLSDPFAAKLEHTKLPPKEAIAYEYRKQYAKKLGIASDADVSASTLEKMTDSHHSNLAKSKDAVRQNAPAFSQRLRVADSLEGMMKSIERVASEGSPKAAYLYFTRMVRVIIPENAENRAQKTLDNTFRIPFVYLKRSFSRFLRVPSYIEGIYVDIGKRGLDNLLLVLDQEEKRIRHSNRIRYVNAHISHLIITPTDVISFAEALRKSGAKADSAAELLSEVPIGQRKYAFRLLSEQKTSFYQRLISVFNMFGRQNGQAIPGFVQLYERLRDYGADARSYISFVTDFANVEVELNGDKRKLQNIVGELAVDETSRSGAAWLVKHPEVWERSDLALILGLAKSSHASMKLELYKRWSDDPIKGNVVLELVPALSARDVGALAAALPKIDREDLRFVPQLTLEGVLSLQKIEAREALFLPAS